MAVLIFELWIALKFEVKTFCLIYPIDAFRPGLLVVQFLEDVTELLFSLQDVIFMSVDEQVIILGKDRDQCLFFYLCIPWQLLKEAKQFVFVNDVPLSQTAHVYDRIQRYFILL